MTTKPTPKFKLDANGKKMFDTIAKCLNAANELKEQDMEYITVCASIYSRVVKQEALVNKNGPVQTYPNGAVAPSADYKILVQERSEFSRYCLSLGITLKGRSAVKMADKKSQAKTSAMRRIKIAK